MTDRPRMATLKLKDNLGKIIKDQREKLNMTPAEAAFRAGMGQSTQWTRLENSKELDGMRLSTAVSVAAALGADLTIFTEKG